MSKYSPLFKQLCVRPDDAVEMTFDEIERLVGSLPASASAHQAWWANETDGHVQARAWIDAGREVVSVDRQRRVVVFSPARWRRGS